MDLKIDKKHDTWFFHKLSMWALKDYFNEEKDIFERAKIHLSFNLAIIHVISVVFLLYTTIINKKYFGIVNLSILLVIILIVLGILKYKKNVRAASILYSIASFIASHIGIIFNPNIIVPLNLVFGICIFLFTFFTLGKKWGLTLMGISVLIWLIYIESLMYENLHSITPYFEGFVGYYQSMIFIGFVMFAYTIIEFLSLRSYVEGILKKNNIELQIAKDTAEQALQIQEQFFANTSHEIRTPINGIIGISRQLMETPLSKEQKEYLSVIKDSSNNLSHIVNDILDISKIRAGKIVFEKTEFKLSELFKTLKFTLQYKADEKKIELKTHIDEKVPDVLIGDPFRLTQIILNLAGNAIKFTDKGNVAIEARKVLDINNTTTIEFSVIDTGIGIPKDKLNYIFESFAQAESHTSRKYGGTGLGLSISKSLIEQQGGEITVKSEENKGSVFSFNLNFELGDQNWEGLSVYQSDDNDEKIDLRNIHVLLVDDNRINRHVATFDLKRWGIIVSEAVDAVSAIDQLSKDKFDLVLMDISMPGMNGLEATNYIRNNMSAALKDIPIIAMTASAILGEKEKCLNAGMNDYISKPFNPATLKTKIAQLTKPERNKTGKITFSNHTTSRNKKLTDLSLMYENANGNSDYIKNIIDVYLRIMPKDLEELNNSINELNWDKVSYLSHKIQSTVAYVGAIGISDRLKSIEDESKKNIVNLDKIRQLSSEIITDCYITISELEDEQKKVFYN